MALLERGADPFGPSPAGDPPLALAVRLGWSRLAMQLIAMGVDLEARDSHGMTRAAPGRRARTRSHRSSCWSRRAPRRRRAPPTDRRRWAWRCRRAVATSADWLDWRGWTLPGRAAAGDGRAGRGDRRRRRCGAPPARPRLRRRHRRCAGLQRVAARRRRRPSHHGRPAARARRRSATCRAHRRDAAVGRGEHAPRRDRRPPARRRRRARTAPARRRHRADARRRARPAGPRARAC